ncbi:MAG: hypothetical protein IPI59_08360 [Sphingobacteriales bacterium]|jgi:hypothetical protein|nr:hypothetical protein [Sphingobacteriales bacterium]MBP9140067.1 hypothetical protein [Chitinophagales bacterium]MDA0197851.1 hypothetical protein [Bacteroidota bacterium]MBK6889928.1 hypothetical protein [Sphingobacteriales bacterium]MBK7527548.1 hypothetical protein [Sphingobacteriales bacterium]
MLKLKQQFLLVFFALTLFLSALSVKACPPPVVIDIDCPEGKDCNPTIIIGDDNEVDIEKGKSPLGEIIDDILDFLGGIIKKKPDTGGDGDDGGDSSGGSDGGGDASGGTDGGDDSSGGEAEAHSFEEHLSQVSDYFLFGKITKEGIILQYPPSTKSCQTSFALNFNFDIPLPPKWLKKYKIQGKRKLKAGRYSTNKKGTLLLPFQNM